jgi:tetratricopeptide (TPR) repeat protein
MRAAVLLVALLSPLAAALTLHAQPHRMPALTRESLERPIGWRTGIGSAHDPIAGAPPEVQRYADQGLALLHDYIWIDAARSFLQARRLAPNDAQILVDLSYAYDGLAMHSAARDAVEQARALAPADAHARAHLEVRRLQIVAQEPGAPILALQAYRQALDTALTQFPQDRELLLLRGLAESPMPGDRGQGSTSSAIPYYRRVVALGGSDMPAHHYLAHAYENAGDAANATVEAAAYARLAPAVPHAHHMVGHNLRRVGRVQDAIREFETADRLQQAYFTTEQVLPETDWHFEHNLDLLGTSYQYVGRIGRAAELLRAAFDLPTANLVQAVNKRQWPMLLRSVGRLDDALAAARTLAQHPHPVVQAVGHIEAAHALLARRDINAAATDANAAVALLRQAGPAGNIAGPSMRLLQGEFALRQGRTDAGRTTIRQAIAAARAARGPDEWAEALFMMEAAAVSAREAGDWTLSAEIADAMLAHDRFYGGSHFAAALAAAHAGQTDRALAEYREARRLWAGADPSFPPLRAIDAALKTSP